MADHVVTKLPIPMTSSAFPEALHHYMRDFKVLLIDVRNREDFQYEHIKANAIVCIEPSVLLRENVSEESLEDAMVIAPQKGHSLFINRDKFDLVAVYDQNSTYFGGHSSPLNILVRTIMENAFHRVLKRAPMMLVGGLDAWKENFGDSELVRGDINVSRSPQLAQLPTCSQHNHFRSMTQPGPDSYGFSNDADIILRSSDNVNFYVISAFLRYVSLVFKDMFASSGSDNNEKKDNLPVVPVTEDSETLCLLLDIIYPSEILPQLPSPFIAWKVSKAAQKYMMNMIERKLKRQIANSRLITEKPLSIYAIAIDLEWEEMAINAARRTLNSSLRELAYVDELHCITGAGFYRFLEYRCLCENSKNRWKELLPPLRRHEGSIEIYPRSSGSDAPHSAHIEDIPFSTASEPYTRSELSDLILRTPDSVDFYVVAALLRLSSPFFNRKFPLENTVTKDGLTVINVQEDSNVLRLLLSFIYPAQEPEIQSAGLYAQLVFAARKYEMVNIEDRVKKHATASPLVTTEPLRVYAVASALGWASLARTAALNTLHTPLHELSFVDEMHLITGAHLFHLVRFRFVCADAACDVLKTDTFEHYGFRKWSKWSTYGYHTYVPDVLYERLNACPRGSTVINVYDQGLSKGIAAAPPPNSGSHHSFYNILRCMQDTPEAVERALSKVDFPS